VDLQLVLARRWTYGGRLSSALGQYSGDSTVEAANFAVRYCSQIKRYYQRKRAKSNGVVAIEMVALKLPRACCCVLRNRVPFEVNRAFGCAPSNRV
jgi:hypothetical protein